ncbi:MAG TPA: DUF6279 family lipoprotein [Burkholderiaceae bacterium]|nr:DUF6279 family lipoprotein [Burkholderiaceae bacterium]
MLSVFRRFWFRSLIIAALCASLVGLTGCSALRLAYATGPDIVYWWLDGYIDFTSAQTPRARESIRSWFVWHRRTQVPDYAAQLVRAQAEVLADTTPARVCEWQAEVLKRVRIAFDRIAPDAAEVMLTVTPAQVKYLEDRYEKFNREYRDAYLQADPRQRADESLKRVVDRAETLYGRLDEAQRERIVEALTRSPFDPELWLAERHARQQDALQILRRVGSTAAGDGATREQALAELRGYVERLARSPRENYRRYSERLAEFNCAFGAALHNATTPAQRHVAAERLAGWEGDLRAIAAGTEPAAAGSTRPGAPP